MDFPWKPAIYIILFWECPVSRHTLAALIALMAAPKVTTLAATRSSAWVSALGRDHGFRDQFLSFLLIKSPSLCLFLIVLMANWHFFLFKIICIFLLGGIPIAGELCVLAGRFPKYILYIMIAKPYSWVKSILGVGHVWRFTGLALSCCCLFSQLPTSLFSLEFFWLLLLLTIKAQHISVLLVNLRTLSWFYPYSWFIRHCLRSNDRPQKPMACEFLRTCRNVHMWRIPGSTSIIRCHISTIYSLVI